MNKFASISSQILTFFSRLDFEKALKETKAEQNAKGFTSWEANIQLLSSRFRLNIPSKPSLYVKQSFFSLPLVVLRGLRHLPTFS